VKRITRTALTLAATMGMVAALAELAAPASATYKPPVFRLVCGTTATGGTLEGSVCTLPFGTTTAPNSYSSTITATAGGALSVVSGSLPAGLTLPATFTGSGDTVSGTPAPPGVEPGSTFTVQGTGDQGQPLYQAYSIQVDPNVPLSINASGGSAFTGTVGQAFAQNFFLSGGAGPYTWSLASGSLPPGLTLQTYVDPRDANDELVGTPTTAGTYSFTMKLTDYDGQQATQKFTMTIAP
jgi:hypothetical protein